MKKIALVLSGGGAKGAFQAGALRYIYEQVIPRYPDFSFSVVSGVSVGSLNGVMIAQNKLPQLLQIWNSINNKDVYTGSLKLPYALYHLAMRSKQAVLSNKPLRKLLWEVVSLQDAQKSGIHFITGTVSLTDGRYHAFSTDDFKDEENFKKAILASSAIPILWEPVARIESKKAVVTQVIDGGLRNNSPLGDILDLDPDEVVIMNCGRFSRDEVLIDVAPDAARNIFTIAKRSLLDIALNEIFVTDLREYLSLNHLVKQASDQGVTLTNRKGKVLKAYKTVLISPEKPLGDMLDFSQPAVQQRLTQGYEAARQAFQHYQPGADVKELYANISLP